MENDVTRANAVSERKNSFRKFDFFSFAVWTNVKRKKSVRRRNKKHSRKKSGSDSKRQNVTNKTKIAAEVTTFVLNH